MTTTQERLQDSINELDYFYIFISNNNGICLNGKTQKTRTIGDILNGFRLQARKITKKYEQRKLDNIPEEQGQALLYEIEDWKTLFSQTMFVLKDTNKIIERSFFHNKDLFIKYLLD